MSDFSQSGSAYKTVPFRPLKGIYRDTGSTTIPLGGFYDIDGFIPDNPGLKRRAGLFPLNIEVPPNIIKWDYLSSYIDNIGVKITYGLANGTFYLLSGKGFIEIQNTYPNIQAGTGSTITVTAGDRVIEGTSTEWLTNSGVVRGDELHVKATGEIFTVDTILTETQIRVNEVPTQDATDAEYEIFRKLTPAGDWSIQTIILDKYLYIVTGKNTVFIYKLDDTDGIYTYWEMAAKEGITLTSDPTERNFIPKTIEVFKDRAWIGNIKSASTSIYNSSRISWTPILNIFDFQPDRLFVDLVTVGGEITAIKALSNLLMVYFEFGINYGRETNIPGDTLPLAFDIVDTGGRGVLQPLAVSLAINGHFFASNDNLYHLAPNLQVTEVANQVKEILFGSSINKTSYTLGNFYEAEGIFVACGEQPGVYNKLFVYNFNTKEWTYFTISADYVTSFALGSRLTYSDYGDNQIYGANPDEPCNDFPWDITRDPVTKYFKNYNARLDDMSNGLDTASMYPVAVPLYAALPEEIEQRYVSSPNDYTPCKLTYGGAENVESIEQLYITTQEHILQYSPESPTDWNVYNIPVILETGDLDFGVPDTYKTITKIAIRLDNQASDDIKFHIEASNDSGRTWWDVGDLTIYQNGKEGRGNFIHTGSAPRFRLTSDSKALQYTLIEMTIDAKARGKQFGDF